ncbi:Dinucleoside triphosphate hydrolase [Polyrhizophydium stewartii]|uniref:Dinucleoside triphosphate hydrolase n=1 Tax=Polyrhizophydium stewartii TaxID=2732419 RepID=A0ABR4N966_9FUNG
MPFKFGPWPIRPSEIFYASRLSFGLVNLKPIVPCLWADCPRTATGPSALLAYPFARLLADTVAVGASDMRAVSLGRELTTRTHSTDVLVVSRRPVMRFNDLTDDEVSDLFRSVQTISKVIEHEYKAESLSITLQDGPHAGQSVPHVHVHIIPRFKGDWLNNDDIYPEIQRKEAQLAHGLASDAGDAKAAAAISAKIKPAGPDAEERPPRTQDDMAAESAVLRKLFQHYEDIWSSS